MCGGPGAAAREGGGGTDAADVFCGAGVEADMLAFDGHHDWLNDAVTPFVVAIGGRLGHGDGTMLGPGLPVVSAVFNPTGPGVITLDRGSAEDGATGQNQRLLPNGSIQAG